MTFKTSSRVAKHHILCCRPLQYLWSYCLTWFMGLANWDTKWLWKQALHSMLSSLQNQWCYMTGGPHQVGLLGLGFFRPRFNVRGLKACCATPGYQMTLETSSSRVVKHYIPYCHPLQNLWSYMINGPRQVGLPGFGCFGPRWNV